MSAPTDTTSAPAKNSQIIQGTVKWFSNKKGYGFITPVQGSQTEQDVFVHQSSIKSEGYRTLDEGWVVEFTIGDDGGRVKAENVTGPGGGPCEGPRKHLNNQNRSRERGSMNGDTRRGGGGGGRYGKDARRNGGPTGGAKSEPHWHADLNENVKVALEKKGIRTSTGTIDVSLGSERVKLGTGGYSSVAHADGILAEGSFQCGPDGSATMQWDRCIVFQDGTWKKVDKESRLSRALSLVDEKVIAVQPDETAQTLWGDGPTDPRDALEENDFKMRRVVLTPRKNGGR